VNQQKKNSGELKDQITSILTSSQVMQNVPSINPKMSIFGKVGRSASKEFYLNQSKINVGNFTV